MPYLKKAESKRIKPVLRESRKERQEIYQSKQWKSLRQSYLMQHPLCEVCLTKGLVTPAIDVHHKDSFSNYEGLKRLEAAYDYSNLMAVCKKCHAWLHRNGRTHG